MEQVSGMPRGGSVSRVSPHLLKPQPIPIQVFLDLFFLPVNKTSLSLISYRVRTHSKEAQCIWRKTRN